MQVFSKRNGIVNSKLELESISIELNKRIVNLFIQFVKCKQTFFQGHFITNIEKVMNELAIDYISPNSKLDNQDNEDNLIYKFSKSDNIKWYEIYDFIEKSLFVSKSNELAKEYDRVLNEEGSLYRIINRLVVPIINDEEIESIQNASSTKYESVNNHIEKALELLQKRQNPDYENSIKESISAVESLCSIITGIDGKNNTLGYTLDLIEENGIHIHTALKEAFKKIYGYASDEKGIRHAGAIENGAKREDAIYMLVSCSAFVNYLIAKYEDKKIKSY